MAKDKRAGAFVPGATGEARESEAVVLRFLLAQLTNIVELAQKPPSAERDRSIAMSAIAGQAMAIPALNDARKGLHKNPAIVVYGNPPAGLERLSKRVYGIEYQHAADGQDYRHDFGSRVQMYETPSGAVLLAHLDGRRLVEEFPG